MSTAQPIGLSSASTLVDVLRFRSETSPDRTAYVFPRDSDGSETACTYKDLDRQAKKIAAWLQLENLCGERVLLVYPQGLQYIAAFLGCLYAGSIAVPVYPPRLNRHLQRIAMVVKDCRPSVALTSRSLFSKIQLAAEKEPELAALRWRAIEEIDSDIAARWIAPAIDEQSVAFLQYTSGSTGQPKGVVVSHGNLICNERMIQHAFEVTEESVIVGWLPLFHDMGLIGNVLQSLWAGARCVLLSPANFLRRPFDWLNAISRYQATISGGPNFAYDLCIAKITAEERAALDLNSWRIAFTGSEPVRAQTLAEFSEKFSCCGFNPNAFFPCYGLAEATLFVSGKTNDGPRTVAVCSDSFARHQFTVSNETEDRVQLLVSSGSAGINEEIAIVDPDTLQRCSRGRIGEIWVSGKNVACGYWDQPQISKTVFHAFTAQDDGPYLRTGDLGYLLDGELFITGRIKDVIIVRGRNHYPQDLEFTVSHSHPAFVGGAGAAFTVEVDGNMQVVLLQEVGTTSKSLDLEELLRIAAQTIVEEHEIHMYIVALVQAGSLPKTSSGKIRRQECRRQFLNAELKVLATTPRTKAAPSNSHATVQDSSPDDPASQDGIAIEKTLLAIIAEILKLLVGEIDINTPLAAYGLDSLHVAELNSAVARTWNVELSLEELLNAPTISAMAALLESRLRHRTKQGHVPIRHTGEGQEWPLSYGQRALLYLYKLAPQAAAYHIPLALHIHGTLDDVALRCAMDALVRRHECLCSVFTTGTNGMVQRLVASPLLSFHLEAAESWTDQQMQARLSKEISGAFDLEQGPLFRAALFRRSRDETVLLLVFHHLITDFASLTVLFEELRQLYADFRRGRKRELPVWPYRYADFVQWQQDMLQSERGKILSEYWKQQLGGGLPVLRLPTDHARPAVQSYRGATFNFRVDNVTTSEIHRLGRAQEVSLYTVLLAAFMVFLHRYSSQPEIVLGSPVSGRTHSCWSGLPGYLINQIIFRAQISGGETFYRFLTHIRRLVASGLAHQDYPLALVAEDLKPERDPAYPALFQLMFSLQKSGPSHDENVVALALGEPGRQVEFDNVKIESFGLNHEATQLDLTLTMAQIEEEFVASFRYNADLFDPSTVTRMAAHFQALLQDIVTGAKCCLDELRLMSPAEQRCVITEWNATARDYPQELQIHDLFSTRTLQQRDSIAVIGGGEELTYAELEQRSNQLAHHLRSKGAGPGAIVGLCMERCGSLMAGILGILKAGAAYLPIDPLFPDERISYLLRDAGVRMVVSQQGLAARLQPHGAEVICFDTNDAIDGGSVESLGLSGSSGHLAYLMYTSGSTGNPKGVMVTHRSVVNFFHAMDERISCTPQDTLLAVTAISFDISVLEFLWTLTRGAKVVLADPLVLPAQAVPARSSPPELDYSVLYFASAGEQQAGNKYELLMEGAKYADKNGFAAVWTPERHFHPFGGLYPNPAVTGAALATITRRIQIRAGSVVLPLHNVIRVAEEWSVVDNLSAGRTGLAFASGWHADDFVFAPQNYANRKELMFQAIEIFLKLWRGEAVAVQSGSGREIEVRIFPRPRQERPPLWITAAGAPDTFVRAGQIGAHILTHLLGQSLEDLAEKVRLYRDSLQKHGHDPDAGRVSLMLHTFLGDDRGKIKDQVRGPFTAYLKSSLDLIKNLARSANLPLNFENMSAKDMEDLLAFAFERYFETSALFGTVKSCETMIEKLRWAGVNEVACLIDFGIENRAALASLSYVRALKRPEARQLRRMSRPVAEMAMAYQPTLMQCTPAVIKLVCAGGLTALRSLRTLMLGGESLPPVLAQEIKKTLACRLVNMYGPTETTIWSSTAEVTSTKDPIHIGKPIANTTMYILDRHSGLPIPTGVIGEVYIGGHGVARGYFNRPGLTAQKFLPDPFATTPGLRLYRTGDLARYLPDGNIEWLGRDDDQVKIRGVRIELGEIEAALGEHPAVAQTVVIARKEDCGDDKRLIAYIVSAQDGMPTIADLRNFLKTKLPEAMIPSGYVFLAELPLTTSGKVNRRLLPEPKAERIEMGMSFVPPTGEYEVAINSIWKRVLNLDEIGIDDNFFDLGGHSLRLVQVHGELTRSLRRDVPLVKLLEYPTIRTLAAYLDARAAKVNQDNDADRVMKQRAAILRQQRTSMMARRQYHGQRNDNSDPAERQ